MILYKKLLQDLYQPVLNDVEHELIIQQSDEVKASEAGSTPQGEIPDDHAWVEAPPEKELSCRSRVVGGVHVRRQNRVNDALQPARPRLQAGLLLQGGLEALLQPGHHVLVAAANPTGLLLHVGKVDPVEVSEHLGDLRLVL